jgi:hypothetical protein
LLANVVIVDKFWYMSANFRSCWAGEKIFDTAFCEKSDIKCIKIECFRAIFRQIRSRKFSRSPSRVHIFQPPPPLQLEILCIHHWSHQTFCRPHALFLAAAGKKYFRYRQIFGLHPRNQYGKIWKSIAIFHVKEIYLKSI